MGKKKHSKGYVSKGLVGHCARTPAVGSERIMNQLNAWKKGKQVKISYNRADEKDNGMPKEWAHHVWGSPSARLKAPKEEGK